MPSIQRECDRCKREYEAQRSSSKYCSVNCRVAAYREHADYNRRQAEYDRAYLENFRSGMASILARLAVATDDDEIVRLGAELLVFTPDALAQMTQAQVTK